MLLDDYIKGVADTDLKTRIVEHDDWRITYPVLGYFNELGGEFVEAFGDSATVEQLQAEFGDVSWYFGAALSHLKINPQILEVILNHPEYKGGKNEKFPHMERKERVFSPSFSELADGMTPAVLNAMGLSVHVSQPALSQAMNLSFVYASKAAGIAKKLHRGDGESYAVPPFDQRMRMALCLSKSYLIALHVARSLGVDPDQAAPENLAKLKDRKERDKLKGDGDNR